MGSSASVTRSKQSTQENHLLVFETWLERLSTSQIIHPDTKPAQVRPASEFVLHEGLRTASTGDIIVFAWKAKEDDLFDVHLHAAMKKYDSTPQDITHSGIIIKMPNSERRFVLESTTSACLDVLEGAHKSRVSGGSRLFSAEYRAAQYPGDVYLLKQKVALLPEQERMLLLQAHKIWCRNPPFDINGLMLCALNRVPALKELVHPPINDLKAWFCSELVACCLRVCGKLGPDFNCSACTPGDLSGLPCVEDTLILLRLYNQIT